jgi:uncharacterized alkaline shock family protein YloU
VEGEAAEASDEVSGEVDDEETEQDDEPVAAEDEAEDEESEESDEPAAVEADEAAGETEEDEELVAEAEPVVEAVPVVESRPAANTRGTVTVDHGIVAKVVTIVAGKIDGVHSLDAEGLSVEVDGDVATIKVSLVIEFGHAVKSLAEQVRTDVIEAVEQFLGFDVAAVDVHVSDIHLPTV